MDGIRAIGLSGITAGNNRVARDAAQISQAFENGGDIVTPIVNLTADEMSVKAAAAVIKVANELDDSLGQILDTRA